MVAKCCALFLLALCLAVPGAASAQSYPGRAIKLVVGFPPGGGNDIQARLIAQKLSKEWGQSVFVENKPGANAIIATDYVARSAPDGYTLYVGATGAMTVNPALYQKLSYDPVKDFVSVVQIASCAMVMVVNPSRPAKTLAQFIEQAKAKPGKFSYASGSTPFQMATELFKMQAGIDIIHIPYKGSAQAIMAGVAGDTDLVTVDLPPALPQIRAGKLRALAVTSLNRASVAPEIPTVSESGLPNFDTGVWTGIFAPAGTRKEIVDKLHDTVLQIIKTDEFKARLTELGFEPSNLSQLQFAAQVKAEIAKWTKVARESNIKIE